MLVAPSGRGYSGGHFLLASGTWYAAARFVTSSQSPPLMFRKPDPNQNHLLSALLDADFDRLAVHLEPIAMKVGDVLYESGDKQPYVYFPTTAIVSLHYLLENGGSSEIAGVGNEGMVGISLIMGGDSTPSRAIVQTGGYGYRMRSVLLGEEFKRAGPLMWLLLRYAQAVMTQMSQTAV